MENIALVIIKIPRVHAAELPVEESEMPTLAPKKQAGRLRPAATNNSAVSSHGDSMPQQPTLGVKFISAGTAACIGDLLTFPLDTAKVRLQIQGEGWAATTGRTALAAATYSSASAAFKYRGMVGTLMTISREEGGRALYNGLVPGLQRQMAFASIRIGLYDSVKNFYLDLFKAEDTVGNKNVGLRILAGITTGGLAVTCAQPTDVVKVRMQAAGRGRKRYSGCMNAYKTIAVNEGVRGLWRGTLPNITRNAVVNATELVSYDLIKEAILKRSLLSDNMPCHFVSAFGAGFCTTVVASPVDVVKTRFMNSSPGTYRGATDCAVRMYGEGGPVAFYKGFMPSFMRLGSWNIVMFVSFEQLKRVFMSMKESSSDLPSSSLTDASANLKRLANS